jgi:hypothetical protein
LLAFAPLALGLAILFFALLWMEWAWLQYVLALFALAAGIWRGYFRQMGIRGARRLLSRTVARRF